MVYEAENIISKKEVTVHVARIILYRANMENKEVSNALQNQIKRSETKYESVDDLVERDEEKKILFL